VKFGPIATKDAEGALLAHSVTAGGKRFKKGRRLTADDVKELLAADLHTTIAARLDPDDIEEDEAAHRLATAVITKEDSGLWAAEPFTGRSNVYARQSGLFKADRALVDRLNRIDPSITFATLPDDTFVDAGRMVATVKIIPLAVPGAALAAAEELASEAVLASVHTVQKSRIAHISTRLSGLKPSVMDKTRETLEKRLAAFGCDMADEVRVSHSEAAVQEALRSVDPDSDLIILFGASAITDPEDVLPAGLRAAGGEIVQLGMPVDPGNLLLFGVLNGTPVVGAPGCARSPVENGFDWVLQRLVCGVPVDPDYVTGLGVGGLLMEITTRPQPREPGSEPK